jgi:hypothetical protein
MNKWIVRASALLALVSLTAGAAIADGKMGTPCPVCKMPLSATKSKDNTVAVKLTKGGKTQYCCAKCKMPASVLVKETKPAPKKGGKM